MEKTLSRAGLLASAALTMAAAAAEPIIGGIQQSLRGFGSKPSSLTRVRLKSSAARYIDKAGMPHNGNGDKLVRKAMTGTVGVRGSRKGFLDNWSSAKVGSMGLGDRRRAKGVT